MPFLDRFRISKLIEAVIDDDKQVHQPAMEQLVRIGKAAIIPILNRLQEFPDVNEAMRTGIRDTGARIRLGDLLGSIGIEAWQPLMDAARRNTTNESFGWSINWAMTKFANICPVDEFIAALSHPNVHVRSAATQGLRKYKDVRAIPALLKTLEEPANEKPLHTIVGHYPSGTLMRYGEDYHQKVRDLAALALKETGEAGIQALSKAAQHKNELVREAAFYGLRGVTAPTIFEYLVQGLKDEHLKARLNALDALEGIIEPLTSEKKSQALALLLEQLHDSNQSLQAHSVKSFVRLGELALNPLIEIVTNPELDAQNETTRWHTASVLSLMVSKAEIADIKDTVFEAMIKVLQEEGHNEPPVRQKAAEILGRIGDQRAVTTLIDGLKDKNCYTLQRMVASLETLGDIRAVEPIETLLNRMEGYEDPEDAYDTPIADLRYQTEHTLKVLKSKL